MNHETNEDYGIRSKSTELTVQYLKMMIIILNKRPPSFMFFLHYKITRIFRRKWNELIFFLFILIRHLFKTLLWLETFAGKTTVNNKFPPGLLLSLKRERNVILSCTQSEALLMFSLALRTLVSVHPLAGSTTAAASNLIRVVTVVVVVEEGNLTTSRDVPL